MDLKILFDWYHENARELPWRKITDPYRIWISEIILQQTRVNQGIDYYYRFLKLFPNIEKLAAAKEEDVLKAWEGLGYYSRARNLHYTAKDILLNYKGSFPKDYDELLKLKGIGPYTAAAIASFAFNRTTPAIDGNVLRVMARFYGIDLEINSSAGLKLFRQKARENIYGTNPALYNQAMMEFGALQCTPSPNCSHCILIDKCVAFQTGKVKELPNKKKKKKPQAKFLHFFMIEKEGKFIVEKRTGKGIWENLYQLPLLETSHKREDISIKDLEKLRQTYGLGKIINLRKLAHTTHILSHQKLDINFWKIEASSINSHKITPDEIKKYPFPIVIANFLDNYFN